LSAGTLEEGLVLNPAVATFAKTHSSSTVWFNDHVEGHGPIIQARLQTGVRRDRLEAKGLAGSQWALG
jgi:hypothetical protein